MKSRFSSKMLAALLMVGAQGANATGAHSHKSCNDCDNCICDYRGCFCLENLQKSATIQYLSDPVELAAAIANNSRVMVKFFLTGRCSSCEAGKLFINLSKESQDGTVFVAFSVSLDATERQAIFDQYGLTSLPTIMLFVDGQKDSVIYPR